LSLSRIITQEIIAALVKSEGAQTPINRTHQTLSNAPNLFFSLKGHAALHHNSQLVAPLGQFFKIDPDSRMNLNESWP
jgi:hypothetical protein